MLHPKSPPEVNHNQVVMKKENIAELFKRLKKHNPEPTTELNYTTPFELLIAVILSAQATDKGVNKATEKLFAIANTPEKILALKESGLKKYIKTIGDSNQRMIRLVNDLLDISRIESGKIQIHPEKTNIVELTQNIIRENKLLADKKNIKIRRN